MIKIPEDMIAGTKHVTKKYGELEIVEYESHASVRVRFTATGYACSARTQHIRSGRVKDVLYPRVCGVGFVGVGDHISNSSNKAYDTWGHMIKRCYSANTQLRQPTYVGCSVAPEWHNFQTFAKWYEDNYPKDGRSYALDKDIKVPGNRVYSPETCMFVTCTENAVAARAKSYVFLSPIKELVEIYNLRAFCRENGLSQSAMCFVARGRAQHHKGWMIPLD